MPPISPAPCLSSETSPPPPALQFVDPFPPPLNPLTPSQIGITVGLLSTSIQSLGLTLQRKSHLLEDLLPSHHPRRPPYRRRRWQLGMSLFIISNVVGSSIQITTLPLPVLSTLQASGLVFNSICATLILSEPFTRWSLGGTVLVATGALLIATFGAIPEPAHTLEQLLELLARRAFLLWMGFQTLLVLSIIAVSLLLRRLPSLPTRPRIRLLLGLSFGMISGILSAHSLLLAKSAVELLVRTVISRSNQFQHWQAWMILVSFVGLALTQLYFLHQGLKLVSTSVLYPLVFCVYNIVAILDGLIYFHQTSLLSALDAGLIALGTVILLSGVLALSWRLEDTQSPPPVSQNPLAPGLGLVEDSDLEIESTAHIEDESTSLLSPDLSQTFPSYSRKHPNLDLYTQESREILSELRDDSPTTPVHSPYTFHPRSSLTLPSPTPKQLNSLGEANGKFASEISPLLGRTNSDPHTNYTGLENGSGCGYGSGSGKFHKRRRRSTGFPGLVPRPLGEDGKTKGHRNRGSGDSHLYGSERAVVVQSENDAEEGYGEEEGVEENVRERRERGGLGWIRRWLWGRSRGGLGRHRRRRGEDGMEDEDPPGVGGGGGGGGEG